MNGKRSNETLIMLSRPHPETNENQHKRFAQHNGSPRRGAPGRRRQNLNYSQLKKNSYCVINKKRLTLKYPIYITIEYENEHVIASFDDVEAFAYADNEFEAVDLLCREIIVLYEDLMEDKENLGPLPRKWFSILDNFIKCN